MTLLRTRLTELLSQAGIYLSPQELADLELTDFGLGDFAACGLAIHTYINSARCCAKELIMLPDQICPEHDHPDGVSEPGKEETFRCRYGAVSIFIEGEATIAPQVALPASLQHFSVFHEVVLRQGQQLTLAPNSKHWFKAHPQGAVLSEFSTHSNDDTDRFTDPAVDRASRVSA
ncbi:D-lyxose/D-mannose family sugar isomerase [Ferrimonas senticii]|uniref:D-lyxose/D-mannose family sugar isomerase n=1 Tax=Ferrimonas senticii TaxID=394566 RepID=UPI000483DEDD|nr:D-lyxose/D-mannose family sugar isomerase [Ferrimonas senticii]